MVLLVFAIANPALSAGNEESNTVEEDGSVDIYFGPGEAPTAAAKNVFEPTPDIEFDWIQLDSGEWLKGDLKVMYNQSLEFDSDKMGLQNFDYEDVIQIRTRDAQRILVQKPGHENEILTGVLEVKNDTFTIHEEGQVTKINRNDVVSIAQQGKTRRDLWAGMLSLGVNVREGNSQTADGTVIANLKRQTALTRYNFDYLANHSRSSGEETANNQRLSGDANVFLTRQFYWRLLDGELYRDVFSNIDIQGSLHTGIGYYLARSVKTEWSVNTGLGYQATKYISVEEGEENQSNSPYLQGGTRLDYELTGSVDYLLDYSFQLLNESNGKYTHHLLTTLSTDLVGDLDVDVSLVWDHIQEPTRDASGNLPEQNDFQLIVSLAYDF